MFKKLCFRVIANTPSRLVFFSRCRLLSPRESAKSFSANGMVGRGGGDRTRPPNYKVPWNEGVAAARKIQLLILLTDLAAQVETNARMFEPPTSWSRTGVSKNLKPCGRGTSKPHDPINPASSG